MSLIIDKELCTLCEACISGCPFGALEIKDEAVFVLDTCTLCGACLESCPVEAMSIEGGKREITIESFEEY